MLLHAGCSPLPSFVREISSSRGLSSNFCPLHLPHTACQSAPSLISMSSFTAKSIVPLLNRVLIRKSKPLEKTAAGILIPERAQEKLNRGEVLAVGPGSEDYKMQLRVGDKVILPAYGGQEIKFEGEGISVVSGETEHVLLYKEEEILAKIKE